VGLENEELIGSVRVDTRPDSEGVSGGSVLAHVQSFAAAVCSTTGACAASTYPGHDPDLTRALDILVSSAFGVSPGDFSLGDSVAAFALDNFSARGVMYVIWRQRINSNDGRGWRQMGDRGSITQNHFDHCHVSFHEGDGGDGGSGGGGSGGGQPMLQQGAEGSDVSRLQQLLNRAGVSVPVTGTFGPLTDAAVRQFQSSRGLTSDGVVGPQTWAALDKQPDQPDVPPGGPGTPSSAARPMLQLDAEGPDVTRLQQLLTAAGFPCSVDGEFGPQTESAVRQFQSSRGLESDGIVGRRTWATLHGEP
jgi:peptidoglycan hydrolase-like protein with peptidoglycan-binding domain